jgi:cell fate regulator YaaT (PSP1 superfamily)
MCCLKYEYADYIEMKKGMPKVGKRIITPEGEGKVVRQNVLEKRVVVALSDGREVEFGVFDLKDSTAARHGSADSEDKLEQDMNKS